MVIFKKFDIIKSTKDEWKEVHNYRKQYHMEDTPEDPMMTDDAFEAQIKGQITNFGMYAEVYGILEDNKIIGLFFFGFFEKTSTSYIGNEKIVMFQIEILRDYRRNGIGTSALKIIAEKCEKNERSIFTCDSHIPETKKFYNAIGAQIAQTQIEVRLKLKDIDWDMVNNWINEGEENNSGTKFIILEGRIPEEYMEEFSKAFTESANEQPRDNLQMGDMVYDVERLRKREETNEVAGVQAFTALTIERDHKISGFTELNISPGMENLVSQGLTGVPVKFRRRKLGKWVKAKMLLYIKEKFPNTQAIVTGNADSNAPMLYINEKLGFKKHKETVMAHVTLERIKSYLNSKSLSPVEIVS